MATKATVKTNTPETNTPEVRMVKIKLARSRKDGKGQYVNVNNHSMWIPRGEVVEVPYYIAEVLENSAEQDERTAAMIDSLVNESRFA